ncbi:hypothetical protein DPMN_182584 [Dreissena polymorpha]|uniref:Uncharacterized protein n=1 Tax=Dreissena polymorpha TaxID=45954 RepID=A0A9D4DHF4_DREPO|nr:hypothetical protein DPMN_182584 [Dreissena polymorpha]
MSDQVMSDGVMSDGVMSEHVTLTADKEESLLRGYIPWDHHLLDTLKSDKKIDQINFAGNGYFNDGLLHMILDHGANKGSFKELTSINLLGCEHVTDHGMRCLATVLQEAVNLREVNLDGCKRLSDDTFAMLENITHSNKTLSCYMRGTDLVYLTGIKKIKTHGCPKITADKKSHDNIEGHILLVPEPGMKNSFAEFLYSGTMTERNASGTLHRSDLTVNDSKLTLTELSPSNVSADCYSQLKLTE